MNSLDRSILITSFKGVYNSSSVVLDDINLKSADKIYLTNSFITSEKELFDQLDKKEYDYIISMGLKPKIEKIYIETTAKLNNQILLTNFDFDKLKKYFENNNINSKISENAGNYLCNNIYYKELEWIYQKKLRTKCTFLHIPTLSSSFDLNYFSSILSNFIKFL